MFHEACSIWQSSFARPDSRGGCPHMILFELLAEGGELLLDLGEVSAETGNLVFEPSEALRRRRDCWYGGLLCE